MTNSRAKGKIYAKNNHKIVKSRSTVEPKGYATYFARKEHQIEIVFVRKHQIQFFSSFRPKRTPNSNTTSTEFNSLFFGQSEVTCKRSLRFGYYTTGNG